MPFDAGESKTGVKSEQRLASSSTGGEGSSVRQAERSLEGLEKNIEKRFGEMKTQLQEIDALLQGSEGILKSMQEDIEAAQNLGEDWHEEGEQYVEYLADIDHAKAERVRLQERLKTLLSQASEEALVDQFKATQAAEDKAYQKARSETTLDDLAAQRSAAEQAGDEKMVDHLESEMLDRYRAMETGPSQMPEKSAEVAPPLPEYGQPGAPTFDPVLEAELERSSRADSVKSYQERRAKMQAELDTERQGKNRQKIIDQLTQNLTLLDRGADTGVMAAENVQRYEALLAEYRKRQEPEERLEGIKALLEGYRAEEAAFRARNAPSAVAAEAGVEESVGTSPLEHGESKEGERTEMTTHERANRFIRLGIQVQWAIDAGGIFSPEVARLRQEQAELVEDQIRELRAQRESERAADPTVDLSAIDENIKDWENQRQMFKLPLKDLLETRKDRTESTKLTERAQYYSSLRRSMAELKRDGEEETSPELQQVQTELQQVAKAQLADLEGPFSDEGNPDWAETVAGWKNAVRESQPNSGIEAAEGMPRILQELADLAQEHEYARVQEGFHHLQQALIGNRRYEGVMDEFASQSKKIAEFAEQIGTRIHDAQVKFEGGALDQASFNALVESVAEDLETLENGARELADTFESRMTPMITRMEQESDPSDAYALNNVSELSQAVSKQSVALQEYASSLSQKRAAWQVLQDYRPATTN